MMDVMDRDGDGHVNSEEFVKYFQERLPRDAGAFDDTMEQFMEAAAIARTEAGSKSRAKSKRPTVAASQESVISTSKDNPMEVKRREAKLRAVFNQFDIDGGGWIEASELLALGKARRLAGHKHTVWNTVKNNTMINHMDTNHDGKADVDEFVKYFQERLPSERDVFDETMEQFMEAASIARERGAGQSLGTSPSRNGAGSRRSSTAGDVTRGNAKGKPRTAVGRAAMAALDDEYEATKRRARDIKSSRGKNAS